jgi:hypothetical protein
VYGEAGGDAVCVGRVVREVDADPDDDRVAGAFEQDAGDFCAIDEEVVGPFQDQPFPASASASGLVPPLTSASPAKAGAQERNVGRSIALVRYLGLRYWAPAFAGEA